MLIYRRRESDRRRVSPRHAVTRRGLTRRCGLEKLDPRRLMAADFELPLGATAGDNGEFLLGRVAVTPVFFESNGAIDEDTQNWTPGEIDSVLATINEGLDWWTDALDALGTVHELEFVVDDAFAVDPFETSYEPIDRPSDDFTRWVSEFVVDQGQSGAASIEAAVSAFNHQQRLKLETDWSFTIFVADASDDDGFFAPGGFSGAFAYAGGLFIVAPSTRPAETFAHELGHQFWARDEYAGGGSYTDQRGYYDTQNLNAWDNPEPGFEQAASIMAGGSLLGDAYDQKISPESTLAMVGWQDTDGDGIFDVLDVPLELEISGQVQTAEDGGSVLSVHGTTSAVPLRNRNPSGFQSDITTNRVDAIQYRIGDGAWSDALVIERRSSDFAFDLPLPDNFQVDDTLEFRAIDFASGVTSDVRRLGDDGVLASPDGITAALQLPSDVPGQSPADSGTLSIELLDENGDPLNQTRVFASDYPQFSDGGLLPTIDGITLRIEEQGFFGVTTKSVGVHRSRMDDETLVLAGLDPSNFNWDSSFDDQTDLIIDFETPISQFTATVAGFDGGHARVTGFDASGNIVARQTTAALVSAEVVDLQIFSREADIVTVVVSGHAEQRVEIHGFEATQRRGVQSVTDGVFRLDNVPPGQYRVAMASENQVYQWPTEVAVTVQAGQAAVAGIFDAQRVDSPWFNGVDAEDVNGDGEVEPLDALLIINQLRRSGGGILDPQASLTASFVDVSNDGMLAPLDALRVINRLRRDETGEPEAELAVTDAPAMLSRRSDSVDFGVNQAFAALSSGTDDFADQAVVDASAVLPDPVRVGGAGERVASAVDAALAEFAVGGGPRASAVATPTDTKHVSTPPRGQQRTREPSGESDVWDLGSVELLMELKTLRWGLNDRVDSSE